MKFSITTCCALVAPLAYSCLALADAKETSDGLIEDSKLTLTNRNFYFNRDFRNGGANSVGRNAQKPLADRNGYAEEWSQGLMADFTSGYTLGDLGLGADAHSYLGLKLDSGGGRTGLRLMPISDEGHPEDSFSKTGASVKVRLSRTELKYGDLFPATPVLWVNMVRLFPSSAKGWLLSSDDISGLHVDGGHFTARSGVDSSNNDDDFNTDYGLPITISSVDYLGGVYKLNDAFSMSLYGSEAKDTWYQYYGNVSYRMALPSQNSLLLRADVYHTDDTGKKHAGPIHNTTWSLSAGYKFSAHSFTLAYQSVDSNEPMDWIGFGTMGGGVSLANAVQYSSFTEPNERSWQVRYDLDFAPFGIPGLTFLSRYVRGDNVDNRHSDNTFYRSRYVYPRGVETRHWERDIEIRYVIKSGPAKDLSLHMRHAVHRSSTGYRYPDNNEVRVIVDYPIRVF